MEKTFSERVAEAKVAIPSISATEADAMRNACEPPVFIDPRPPEAIAATTGLIPGAHNVTLDDILAGNLPESLGDKWTRVVTACQAGSMGAVAAHELAKLGFSRVSYLEGGTQGWLEAGLPTAR